MRALKFLSLFAVLTVLISACGTPPNSNSSGELKVALLVGVSGPAPTFGISTRDGALMAIDEWNATGGVLGR